MGRAQRQKGATFEREISHRLRRWLSEVGLTVGDDTAKRKLGQARDAGNDIDVGEPVLLVVECKRRKTLGTIYQWLTQAEAATQHRFPGSVAGLAPHPVVIAREDGGEPLAILHLEDFIALSSLALRENNQPLPTP